MIYESSTGEYYSGLDIWLRFESGRWEPHDWCQETGREWVKAADGHVLTLTPIEAADLPDGIAVTEDSDIEARSPD